MFRIVNRLNQITLRNASYRSASTTSVSSISNIEKQWKSFTTEEQQSLTKQIEELQKQDWNKLSLEEKKTAYYISFGPHGPREPYLKPGHTNKLIAGITGVVVISFGLFYLAHRAVPDKPLSMNKEWQEATNEKLRRQNANPITGISSAGYKGKGYVQSE
ncbi:6271_t:CDS:2 [Diversispora eburnea]|uniref:6271_t:CDS:1 n=1 Tax=Diversispora eburnea TaxID=1213867 RepID=A0A9N9G9I6_9GLOM|nr:6271_t:CDS:2 [Diversispora eburnea]